MSDAGELDLQHDHDHDHAARRPSLAGRGLLGAIHLYQVARAGRPSPCRYIPSCSSYAAEAVRTHGSVRGSWLAVRRLCRCHPFGSSGFDPVPPPRKAL
jgi:putative membrane protein insertion efficiency factor